MKPTTTLTTLLFLMPAVATAFSSIAVPYHNTPHNNGKTAAPAQSITSTTTAPWRVVLDIGREPLSTMPFDWARSGGRMPVKIPCDFVQTINGDAAVVQPQSDTVSFTGPDGAVIRPIHGGNYQIVTGKNKHQELTFDLHFPETLARRDVTIEAGTTIQCTARMYTQTELDRLYQAFYDARDKAWAIGGELNDMMTVEGPPKRWNEATQQWETRRKSVNPWQWAQTRIAYTAAKAAQARANDQRPDPNDLSERGPFPDIQDNVYFAKQGTVKTQSGAVIGRWSMEPILNDRAVSYR